MIRILPLVGIIGLMLYTFFDVLATDRRRFTSLSKGLWLLVALLPVIGAMLWIVVGKPRRPRKSGGDSVISLHRRDRPIAPDDDPEFLRRLDEQAWRARRESARRTSQQQSAADPADAPAQDGAEPEPGPAVVEGLAEPAPEPAPEPAADQGVERAAGDDEEPPAPGEQAKPAQ